MGKGSGRCDTRAPFSLYDGKTGQHVTWDKETVGIYACGPTVYSRVHIGNARPFVVFSILRRFLQRCGYQPQLVINVTDINDKIYHAANEAGVPSTQLAEEMTAAYIADTDRLGLGRPDHEPLATETMPEIISLINDLINAGAAYESDGDVYFTVRSDSAYGSLSHRHVDESEVDEDSDRKRDPLDFALWKATKPGEDAAWDSPWGMGRPGWHIECSAMAEKLLGLEFAIHGGGSDLLFPHHENEAAQTRQARGAELAQIWMHNGMIQVNGEKGSKTDGNIMGLAEAIDTFGRDTLVLYMMSSHYRKPMQWNDTTLNQAKTGVQRLAEIGRHTVDGPSPPQLAAHKEQFFDALHDDFNTPHAVAHLWGWVGEAFKHDRPGNDDLREMLDVFALTNLLQSVREPSNDDLSLLQQRTAAKQRKDYAAADTIRQQLQARGWEVRDNAAGAELVSAE